MQESRPAAARTAAVMVGRSSRTRVAAPNEAAMPIPLVPVPSHPKDSGRSKGGGVHREPSPVPA